MKTDNSIIYSIRWNNLANESYLYGSSIVFESNGTVKFSNHLMPPGQIIRKWQSVTNYQALRHEPQLPILEEGECYEIRSYATCKPDGGVKLRLKFFDRQGEEKETIIIDDLIDEFVCPNGASNYDLDLINAGAEELVFHHIEIQKKSDAENNVRLINPDSNVYVLILEPTGSSYIFPEERLLSRFRNRVILTCEGADFIDLNKSIADNIPTDINAKHVSVIGYGTRSNESALRYAKRIGPGVKLYTYGQSPKRLKSGIQNIVHGNDKDSKKEAQISLMAPLCDKTNRLAKLKLM